MNLIHLFPRKPQKQYPMKHCANPLCAREMYHEEWFKMGLKDWLDKQTCSRRCFAQLRRIRKREVSMV